MLIMAMILTATCAWIEIKFARQIPPLWYLMENGLGPIGAGLFNLVFSLGLSITLGHLFGVTGLIAFVAGLASTWITNMYYPHEDQINLVRERVSNVSSNLKSTAVKTQAVYADVKQPLTDFGTLIMGIVKFIVLPFTVLRWAGKRYTERRTGL